MAVQGVPCTAIFGFNGHSLVIQTLILDNPALLEPTNHFNVAVYRYLRNFVPLVRATM